MLRSSQLVELIMITLAKVEERLAIVEELAIHLFVVVVNDNSGLHRRRHRGGRIELRVLGQGRSGGCVDDERVYGFGRKPEYYRWTTPMEYQLFAASRDASVHVPEPEPEEPAGDAKGKKKKKSKRNAVDDIFDGL